MALSLSFVAQSPGVHKNQRDFYMTSSWQEAPLLSLTSRSPGQPLLGRHGYRIVSLKGHTAARADKQFCGQSHSKLILK